MSDQKLLTAVSQLAAALVRDKIDFLVSLSTNPITVCANFTTKEGEKFYLNTPRTYQVWCPSFAILKEGILRVYWQFEADGCIYIPKGLR